MTKCFLSGEQVLHPRFGRGTIVQEWGTWPLTDEKDRPILKMGDQVMIQGKGIYDVMFGAEHRARSVNGCRLVLLRG